MIDEKTGIDFPFFQSQVVDIFGQPDENGPFAQNYLRTLDLTEYADALGHVLDCEGNPWGHKIYCNFAMHGPLKRAFGLIVSRGLTDQLRTYDGSFNIRQSKGGGMMSMHSWGLAVDFNAGTNPFGQEGDMSPEMVKCFAESGMESGTLWSTPDGMHFQIVWTSSKWLTSDDPLRPIPWVA